MKVGIWIFMFTFLIGGCLWVVCRLMVGVIRKNRDDARVAEALEEIAPAVKRISELLEKKYVSERGVCSEDGEPYHS